MWGQQKRSNDPRNNQHNPQYANYRAPLTRKRHIPPHSAQPRHTNHWAPRTRKRHQREHRPQRPTERSDPTQHAKGRTGDCPGPRKETTTRRNVTQGEILVWGGRRVGQEGVRDMGTQERHQTGGGATQTHRTREPHQEGQGRAQQTRRRGTARRERQLEQREQRTRMERMAPHHVVRRTETQRGRRWTACGQRCVDSKNSQTTPATTSTSLNTPTTGRR